MTFPFMLDFFGHEVHPHPVLEGLGYFCGARLYFALRRRQPDKAVPMEINLWIIFGALVGAFLGAKMLAWIESPSEYIGQDWSALLGGKTIVGGLLGGWAGVEVVKKVNGIQASTGDLFVYPLALGNAIGRVGCFLTGLSDHTYGIATTLPWGVDFGDGIRRHPTQLYESIFVLGWAFTLWLITRRHTLPPGVLFRLYLAGYLGWRFLVEFIKPRELLIGDLSAIQTASLVGMIIALGSAVRLVRRAKIMQSLAT